MSPIATGVHCTPLEGQLENHAAAAFNSMALGAGQRLAINGCDSAYRPLARQDYYREYWCALGSCGNAAIPGTSNHGLGLAIDVSQATRGYIDLHGKRYGWCKCWSDAPTEWWHIKWNAVFHRPNPGTNLHDPILRLHSGGPGQGVYVRKVQKLLRGHGDKSVTVDGEFGHSTKVAVEHFQHAQYLKVNGIVSPRVWKRLRRPLSKPIKTTPKHVPHTAKAPPAVKHPKHHKPKKKHRHHHKPKGPAWGIDVSSNNGEIDWGAVRHAGASFACVKASEGQDYVDFGFGRKKMRAVTEAGLVPCVYHYLRPRADRTGAREAAWFTQVVGHAGYGKGFLPPVLDVETSELNPQATCRYVGSFLRLVRRNLGVKAIVYTYPSFAQTYFSSCSWLGKYRLWIADYGVSKAVVPSPPWSTDLLWQYTSTATVAGVNGDVDVDKLVGGRSALVDLRVKKLPRRARRAPRAKVKLPLGGESRKQLINAAPTVADERPVDQVKAPR
jgi:GH25 family lysozyme M1 (1,4-beta-N-acetylmuramidase)